MGADVLIGTSGWQYKDWRGRFYPAEVPQSRWLEFHAQRFRTVEVNNTFYRLPEKTTFSQWRLRTPSDFLITVKVSRYLTHIKRLTDPHEPVARLMERANLLGKKLGPLLVQLPPNLKADAVLLDDALSAFPPGVKVAVEFRHPSWFKDEVRGVLSRHGSALCLVDRRGRSVGPVWRTSDWGYLRFHEGAAIPNPCYGQASLARWAEILADGWHDADNIFVYFNNDPLGCAVRDASLFAVQVQRAGLSSSRVPELEGISVG